MSGLVPLGDPDAIACEGDACVIPETTLAGTVTPEAKREEPAAR